jgi:hypothetical protein
MSAGDGGHDPVVPWALGEQQDCWTTATSAWQRQQQQQQAQHTLCSVCVLGCALYSLALVENHRQEATTRFLVHTAKAAAHLASGWHVWQCRSSTLIASGSATRVVTSALT